MAVHPQNTLCSTGIHLAEAGNMLIRNVDFEIPYFKKLAEKTQQQLADQEHKHEEYLRSAEAATRDYDQVCIMSLANAEEC